MSSRRNRVPEAPLSVLEQFVPDELKGLRAWLVWKYEQRAGEPKPRKVPYYVGGGRRAGRQGEPGDRDRWAPFDAAIEACDGGGFDGLGFALSSDWGFVALDFDNCVSDGVILPEVEAVIAGTYAERSPSGRGVRAFFQGALKDRKSTEPHQPFGFEVFCSKGYVTVTGEAIGAERRIAPLTAEVRALYAERFGSAARQRASGVAADATSHGTGLRERLLARDPDCAYDEWVRVGMALHHASHGAAEMLDLWDEWSSGGGKYPGREDLEAKWASFRREKGQPKASLAGVGLEEPAEVDDFSALEGYELPECLTRTRDGRIKPTMGNVVALLGVPGLLGVRLAVDSFEAREVCAFDDEPFRPLEDADLTEIRLRLERRAGCAADKTNVRDAVLNVATSNAIDTGRERLETLVWDGVDRIDRFFVDYFGTADDAYHLAVGRYVWTALAGRTLSPGVQADMAVVLIGAQGAGKSRAVKAMVWPSAYRELSLAMPEQDRARLLRGCQIAELAELKGLRKADHEDLKAWITRRCEEWVPKYREYAVTYERRCVFVGTTNEDQIFSDPTGNRRFLPVQVGVIDVDAIESDRDQLWAEAACRFRADGVAWKDAEDLAPEHHEEYRVEDTWECAVADWLKGAQRDGAPVEAAGFTTGEALEGAVYLHVGKTERRDQMRMSTVLKHLGYRQRKTERNGRSVRLWRKV